MTRRPRRNHTAAFKSRVALSAIRGEQTISELSHTYDLHPNQITKWRDDLLKGANIIFESGSKACDAAPVIDVKSLHAKIGELTLENDFLETALTKAGLLSARK